MFLKFSSVTLLSLAAPLIVAGGASGATAKRSLQASVSCLANNGTYASCCPVEGVDPNDGVCTLLSCLEMESGLSIRDGCSCREIEKACDQLAVFATGFAALPDMCDMAGECCVDDGTTTTNVDWDFCMAEAQEAGNFTLPDLWFINDDVVTTTSVPITPAPAAIAVTAPTSNPTTMATNVPTTLAPTVMIVTAPTSNPTITTTHLPTTPAPTDVTVTTPTSNPTTATTTMSPTTVLPASITTAASPTTTPTSNTTTGNATGVISNSTPTTAPTSNVTAAVKSMKNDGRGGGSSAIAWVLIAVITLTIIGGVWYHKNRKARSNNSNHESHAVVDTDSVV